MERLSTGIEWARVLGGSKKTLLKYPNGEAFGDSELDNDYRPFEHRISTSRSFAVDAEFRYVTSSSMVTKFPSSFTIFRFSIAFGSSEQDTFH